MHYQDSLEKSAEYLRLAIQHMSRQSAALHPISYAVWYEYVSGRNASLIAEIDALTTTGTKLDEAATQVMFRKHVAEIDEAVATRVGQGLQKVMADISRSASEAGSEAARFGSALEKWTEGRIESPDASGEVGDLMQHTKQMQGAVGSLKQKLADSNREIEELRSEVHKARQEALADGLTGLANRKSFDQALSAALAGAVKDHGLTLLIADIDHFKRVNDTYGHLFGDKVIRAVADILKQSIKGRDTAARFGGEEFVVLLPDTPSSGGRQLAEQIRATVEKLHIKRLDKNETVANITVSLGVATYRAGEPATELLARADKALYASKENGRNRVTLENA